MSLTRQRTIQYIGILFSLFLIAVGYWYFSARAGTKQGAPLGGPAPSNLVGYWSFDGDDISGTTAYDRSGSGNNGTTSGSPAKTDGKLGQALNFDGVAARISLGAPSFTQTDAEGTVTAWVKGSGYYLAKTDNGVPGGDWQYSLRFSIASSKVCLSSQPTTTELLAVCTTNTIDTTVWNFVATKVSTAGGTEIYVNGVKQSLTYTTGSQATHLWFSDAWKTGTNVLYVGVRNINGSPAGYFTGSIDEVRVYNAALTATQIYDLYKLGGETVGASTPTRDSLNEGLAGYWKLDDASGTTATDSSTNGNNGTLTNGPTWGTGQIGGDVDIDGTDDYINIGDVLDVTDGQDFSVSGWFYRDTDTSSDTIIYKGTVTGLGYYVVLTSNIDGDPRKLKLRVSDGTDVYTVVSSQTIVTGVWTHFMAVFDDSSTSGTSLYINGVLDNSTKTGTLSNVNDLSSTAHLRIGAASYDGSGVFDGKLDEIRFYNRPLSADEITKLYKTTTPSNPDTRLKGYWSFDGDAISGTTAYDRSGLGNNAGISYATKTEGIRGQGLNFATWANTVIPSGGGTVDFGSGDFSVSTFFRAGAFVSYGVPYKGLVTKFDGSVGNSAGYGLLQNSSNQIYFRMSNGTTTYNTTASPNVVDGAWHHAVGVRSGGTTYLYIDGVQVGTGTASGSVGSGLPWIGSVYQVSGEAAFAGDLDEVRIYNAALTASEIYNLYKEGGVKVNKSQSNNGDSLNDGLAGYWKLDDASGTTATDSSGNANNGTLTNGPTWGTGQIGGATAFDGADDYITLGSPATLDNISQKTVTAWVKLTTFGENAVGSVLNKYHATSAGWNLYVDDNGGGFQRLRFDQHFTGLAGWWNTPTNVLTTGQWMFVTVSYDRTSTVNDPVFYVNGVKVATGEGQAPAGSASDDSANDLYIGNRNGLDRTFNGSIDEVRIYNRILSAEEVSRLYKTTSPTNPETGLVGYWSFNGKDLSGTTAYDRSGKGNNGTLTNGPAIIEGKIGQALRFDANNDQVNIGSPTILDNLSTLTFSAWIKPASNGKNNLGVIAVKGPRYNPTTSGWVLRMNMTMNLSFQVDFSTTDLARATNSNSIPINQWSHVLVTWDGTTVAANTHIYVNGTELSYMTSTNGSGSHASDAAENFMIGDGILADSVFDGSIDEVRVYNRVLSDTEIANLYNFGR